MEEEGEEEEKIIVREVAVSPARSVINIKFPLRQTRRAVVVLQRGSHHQQEEKWQRGGRCVMVKVALKEPGPVTLHDLTLQHGAYKVVVFKNEPTGGGKRGEGGLMQLSHGFTLPHRLKQSEHHRTLSRQRRHKATLRHRQNIPNQELILQNLGQEEEEEVVEAAEEGKNVSQSSYSSDGEGLAGGWGGSEDEGGGGGGGGGGSLCLCCNCFNFFLGYEEWNAVLTFNYSVNSSCDSACSVVNIQLYRDDSESALQCVGEKAILPLKGMERIGMDKNVTKGPIRYRNIRRGCYFMELKPQMYRMPERTRFLWAEPAITVTNMNNWTTVFFLEPNPQKRSMTVRWSVVHPYNFSAYELTLHHHPALRINCTGKQIFPNMSIIPPHDRLVLTKPKYPFFNLSSGWYCARVTPRDDRCPIDGCKVISSPAIRLLEPEQLTCPDGGDGVGGSECGEGSALGLSLLVVGCVVGAVVTGVTVAWGLLHIWPTLSEVFSSTHYSPVPLRTGAKASLGQRQIVLLVWTPQGPYGAQYMPIIAAFKILLRTYGNCDVYDYLELSSLPEKHQLRLLSSPTTWLDSILANHSIKVIIVATEGAWQRQMEWRQLAPTPHKENGLVSSPCHAHDQILFPYLLRRLHDQPELAGDYSRIFHVMFSEVCQASVELPHIVSLKRYRIPEHLRSLAISMHGGVSAASFEEPKDDQLAELRAALSSHPQFRSHSDSGSSLQWSGLVENGHATIPDVASSCMKSAEESEAALSSVASRNARFDGGAQDSW